MHKTRWNMMVRSAVGVAVIVLLSLVAPVATGVSGATGPTAPPWEPDANAAPYGNIVFYDASGNQVTSGTNDLSSPFAYAVATVNGADPGANQATAYFFVPVHGVVPGNWNGTQESGTTTFSPASALPAGTPADIKADAPSHPLDAVSSADVTTWIAANSGVIDNTTGYANTIEVRLVDSGPGGAGNAGSGFYWETDIGYNTTASPITVDGTTVPAMGWAQLFPLVTSTTTTVTSTKASPQPAGTNIPLTATVVPAKAGTAQFFDGATALGSPVTVSAGTASFTDMRPPAVGAHSYTAVFTPTLGDETGANTASATIVGQSTSSALPFTINAAGTPTTTTLTSSKNPSMTGKQVTYTATVSRTPDGGTVAFADGATTISGCATQALTSGMATCSATYTTVGQHSVTAKYSGDASFNTSTSSALTQVVTTSPGGFVPLTPDRLMDTRSNLGAAGPVGAKATVKLQVLGADGGLVPGSGVGAVVLNVTVTGGQRPGFITVYPDGASQPTTSNLNYSANETVPNLVVAPVGADGKVDFFNGSTGSVQVIADVSGWFASATPAAAGGLTPLTPDRLMDTRSNLGASGPVGAKATVKLQVLGADGGLVPGSGVGAVVLNVTVTGGQRPGFITVYPDGASQPTTSNLNYLANETVPNLVVAPVGADGKVDFFNGSTGSVQVIADVSGWFTSATPAAAGGLTPLTPDRLMDTRSNLGASGPVGAKATVKLQVLGADGGLVPGSGVGAVVLNVTVTGGQRPGFITVYPDGASQPTTSNLNYLANETVPNLVVAPVGADGKVDFFNGSTGSVQVIADVSGWMSTP